MPLPNADAFIVVAAPGIVTVEMVRSMVTHPIIFALANTSPEIDPGDGIRAGAAVIATGRNTLPHQCNFVPAFPGISRVALDPRATRITAGITARGLAGTIRVPPEGSDTAPHPQQLQVTEPVSAAVGEHASREGCVPALWPGLFYLRRGKHVQMTSEAKRAGIMADVEDLFDRTGRSRLKEIDGKLQSLGFVEHGADPAVVEMVHHSCRLFLVITLDDDGFIHGYELLPEEEWETRQEKFRW